jgi:hypothetical protein
VVNEAVWPDYDGAAFGDVSGVTAQSYLSVESVGTATTAEGLDLPLASNFPTRTPATTARRPTPTRSTTEPTAREGTTRVHLRYTFALLTVNESTYGYLSDGSKSGVTAGDVSSGHSELVINGENDHGEITDEGASSAGAKHYDALQAVAGTHPAVITSKASSDVTIVDEAADSSATGNSNPGAEWRPTLRTFSTTQTSVTPFDSVPTFSISMSTWSPSRSVKSLGGTTEVPVSSTDSSGSSLWRVR